MTFVGGSDPSWREALALRDPLAGARVLPSAAGLDERRAAALLLWQHYAERRVWMSGRAPRQSLTDDVKAIGKLLRPNDLPDVVDIVLGGVHSQSPQTRSNVMNVLSSAGLSKDLLTLLRVTLSGDDNEVVRRQSAALARDHHFKEAFPLIRKCALQAKHLEAQVMISVGASLATDDELLAFALDVERSGQGKHWSAEYEVRHRLGPGPALKVLTARSEHGHDAVLGGIIVRDVMKDLPETRKLLWTWALSRLWEVTRRPCWAR